MDFNIFPYGNAKQSQKPDGSWAFTCQHGAEECTGNLIEACAMNFHNSTSEWFPFINCIESSSKSPAKSAPSCAKASGWSDYDSNILPCTTSKLGNSLMHDIGSATDNLNPPHKWTPWVVLNGKALTEDQLDQHLLALVCKAYTGAKPAGCSKAAASKLCMRDPVEA